MVVCFRSVYKQGSYLKGRKSNKKLMKNMTVSCRNEHTDSIMRWMVASDRPNKSSPQMNSGKTFNKPSFSRCFWIEVTISSQDPETQVKQIPSQIPFTPRNMTKVIIQHAILRYYYVSWAWYLSWSAILVLYIFHYQYYIKNVQALIKVYMRIFEIGNICLIMVY